LKLDEELAGRAQELERERRQRDAEDEAKIQASERALAAAGVVNDVATAASVRTKFSDRLTSTTSEH
jgi:hypothetical protein